MALMDGTVFFLDDAALRPAGLDRSEVDRIGVADFFPSDEAVIVAAGVLGAGLRHHAAGRQRLHQEPVHRRVRVADPPLADEIKMGVLARSVLAARAGAAVLSLAGDRRSVPPR